MNEDLPQTVVREVWVPAPADVVWRFLATDDGWAAWWGPGSTIDARPGGAMAIAYPNGQTAEGTVIAVDPGQAISFTWGFDRDPTPVPVDGSTVFLTLTATEEGTTVRLVHRLADEDAANQHVAGWRYQLGLFRAAVAGAVLAPGLAALVDAWHACWSGSGADGLAAVVTSDVVVDEPMAALAGISDVAAWAGAVRQFRPGVVRRTGAPALCGDLATWDWEVEANGAVIATGRSVGRVTADGRFRQVTGFWLTAPAGFTVSTVG
ncbi:MAG: SRPBCC family protein [Acidimicrobiia bacterium]